MTSTSPTASPAPIVVHLPDPPPPRPVHFAPRPAVLVVLSPDNFCEVFASPGVKVAIAERLDVHPADEALAEQYLEAGLPAWARDIFRPMDLVATLAPRPATPSDALDTLTERAALSGLRDLERKGGRR